MYEDFILTNENKADFPKSISFHDAYVYSYKHEVRSGIVEVELKNPFYKYNGVLYAENVAYFSMSEFYMWDRLIGGPIRISGMGTEDAEIINEFIFECYKRGGGDLNSYHSHDFSEYIFLTFETVTGDHIQIIAKQFVWKKDVETEQ